MIAGSYRRASSLFGGKTPKTRRKRTPSKFQYCRSSLTRTGKMSYGKRNGSGSLPTGGVKDPEDDRLAAGGCGIFFGQRHPLNMAAIVEGRKMDSYRAEIQAVRLTLSGCKKWTTKLWITLDNLAVVGGLEPPVTNERCHRQSLSLSSQASGMCCFCSCLARAASRPIYSGRPVEQDG